MQERDPSSYVYSDGAAPRMPGFVGHLATAQRIVTRQAHMRAGSQGCAEGRECRRCCYANHVVEIDDHPAANRLVVSYAKASVTTHPDTSVDLDRALHPHASPIQRM